MEKIIYVDNAATTPITKNVYNAMLPYLQNIYGNPSSVHRAGRIAKEAIENARTVVARAIGARLSSEIVFTGSGSEANNLALKGILASKKKYGNHIITSKIEHHATLHTAEYLEKCGFKVTYLSVDEFGTVSLDELKKSITKDTALVSIMSANNEVGTIQPIKEIGEICKANNVLFHTDAVQAIGHIHMDVQSMNIDLLSLSGHKIGAPKGIGALYVRKGVILEPTNHGGGQEKSLRSGTENVAGIVALARAIEDATIHLDENMAYVQGLRDRFIEGALKIPYVTLTGHKTNRLPGTASIVIKAIEGEGLLLKLDMAGICASTGSACASGSLDPSHVLLALGLSHETAHGSLRVSFGKQNTAEQVDYIIENLERIISELRAISPLWSKEDSTR